MGAYEIYSVKDIKNRRLKRLMKSAKLDAMYLFPTGLYDNTAYGVIFRRNISERKCVDFTLRVKYGIYIEHFEVKLSKSSEDLSDAVMSAIDKHISDICKQIMIEDFIFHNAHSITLIDAGESFEQACIRLDLTVDGNN